MPATWSACPHLKAPIDRNVELYRFPLRDNGEYFACRKCAVRLMQIIRKRDAEKKAAQERERIEK